MKAGAITYDVLVIGAGVAGSAVATALARQGRRVLLVERSLKEPDRIVGELLQPGGVKALSKLGLTHCLEGIEASPIEGYHLYWRDQQATFWFCAESGEDARKPEGRSFHHGRFVSKLRSAAAAEPDVTILQATALEIIRDEQSGAVLGASCAEAGGPAGKYYAHVTILADGSTSNFRSQFTPHRPGSRSRFWGLEMIDADLPFPRYACGLLGSGPPVLMYQIGARETRMLVDIPDKVYRTLDGSEGVRDHIRRRVACNAPESVRPSLDRAIATGRLRSMPNAWLPATRNPTPGLVILGDALNMRHPVTGGGMTVALKDVVLLTDMLSPANVPSLGDTALVLKTMKGFHWKRKAYSSSLNILAQALYFLFTSEDSSLGIMQRGFIRYVQEGERNFAEPAGIMGGITQNSNILLSSPSPSTAYFWASKPQNVAEPTVIQVDWTIADLLLSAGDAARELYVDTPMDFIEKPVWDGWRRAPSLLHHGGPEKRPLERIPNDYSPPPPTGTEATIIWVVSVVHAMIHVLGWWFPFPTEAEKTIWRSSSLTPLVVMAIGGLVPVLSTRPWFDFTFSLLWIWVREAKKNKSFVRRWLFRVVVDFAYSDVDWTSWWPHANG